MEPFQTSKNKKEHILHILPFMLILLIAVMAPGVVSHAAEQSEIDKLEKRSDHSVVINRLYR